MKPSGLHVKTLDDQVSIAGPKGDTLLDDCYGNVHLSNGTFFSMRAMEKKLRLSDQTVIVETGGNDILPHLKWTASRVSQTTLKITLSVKNTTPAPLAIERLDVLISPDGYLTIRSDELFVQRTGWQSFGTAGVRAPFTADDPWLQPPLHMPNMPTSSSEQRQLPWMTVLQSDKTPPLLLGFGAANNYLGMINLRSSSQGHRINATNYVEGIELMPGATIKSEPLLVIGGEAEDRLLELYGSNVGKRMHARVPAAPPAGWSSWFHYFTEVTEKDMLTNVTAIKERGLPIKYIGLDDGYQTEFGDWLSINKKKFPHGPKFVATVIRDAGYKPGIWLTPFMANANSEVVKNHPEWFLRDTHGRLINVNRRGDVYWSSENYGLDITHPDAYAWLKNVITTICKEWGFESLKIDYMYAGAQRAVRYDPNCTSVQAYRRGLALIREIAGERLIIGCGAPLLCSVGYVDAMRISADLLWSMRPYDATLPRSRDPLNSLFAHLWMNKRLWINDPDYVHVRQGKNTLSWSEVNKSDGTAQKGGGVSKAQTQALISLISLSGGTVYDSDNIASLDADEYRLLERVFPPADVVATPVVKAAGRPSRVLATVNRGDGQWFVAARFNWDDTRIASRFYPMKWGLPNKRYHLYDLINERYLGTHFYQRLTDIPPLGVSLYSLCPVTDRPQVIATRGHLLGPIGDIAKVGWRHNRLDIMQTASKHRVTEICVHVPLGYRLVSHEGCEVAQKDGRLLIIVTRSTSCSLSFTSPGLSLRSRFDKQKSDNQERKR